MAEIADGPHLLRQPPVNHGGGGPQVLSPAPNRHFPLPAAFLSDLNRQSQVPDSMLKPMMKKENNELQNIHGPTFQWHEEETRTNIPPTVSGVGAKPRKIRRLSKEKQLMVHASGSADGIPDIFASNSCRYDSSLSLLAKKFVNLLQQTKDGTIDLNEAAEILQVQKRRIYDITNVLEGVGLMEKFLKNRIRWTGADMVGPAELEVQKAKLKAENEALHKEESRLDEMISEVEEKMKFLAEESDPKKLLYLTREDINSLPHFQNSTLIAVEAPHGTSLEVLDPVEGFDFPRRRYQMFVRSVLGPVNCYLIRNNERQEASNLNLHPAPMDSSTNDGFCMHPEQQDASTTSSPVQQVGNSLNNYSVSLMSEQNAGGFMKIVPADDVDADYWFGSDLDSSLTDMWSECILYNSIRL